MLTTKQSNRANLPAYEHVIWLIYSVFLVLLVCCLVIHNAWTMPYADYGGKRLAVLELQGNVGSIQQKQIWTDHIRATSIKMLKAEGIQVIDRDQFKILLDPSKSLSDCTDLCAAEMARELGAHWSLNGKLSKLNLDKQQTMMITLKLHDASGTLLGIEQKSFSKLATIESNLSKLTRSLLNGSLITEESDTAPSRQESNVDGLDEQSDVQSQIDRQEFTGLEKPILVKTKSGTLCITPLIKNSEYNECVQEGICSTRPQWSSCQRKQSEPVNCVNLKQALVYSQWKKASLPSLSSLKALFAQTKLQLEAFEWVSPMNESLTKEAQLWRNTIIKLNDRKLKTYPKQNLAQGQQRQGQIQIVQKTYPPAFQVKRLSFRIVTSDLTPCK